MFKEILGSLSFVDRQYCRRLGRREAKLVDKDQNRFDPDLVVVVYDHLCSPPTFGDFIEISMFARWFAAQGIQTELWVIDGEYRDDWNELQDVQSHVQLEIRIGQTILGGLDAQLKVAEWHEFTKIMQTRSTKTHIPFSDRIANRRDVYGITMSALNYMVRDAPDLIDAWRLKARGFSKKTESESWSVINKPYISWNVRMSNHSDINRNTVDEEFVRIANELHANFPDHVLLVVSDVNACTYFRKVALAGGINCLFADEISNDFVDHIAMVLNSDFFFQSRGGGLAEIAIYSDIEFELFYGLSRPRYQWSRSKLTAWQTKKQIFHKVDARVTTIHLPSLRN